MLFGSGMDMVSRMVVVDVDGIGCFVVYCIVVGLSSRLMVISIVMDVVFVVFFGYGIWVYGSCVSVWVMVVIGWYVRFVIWVSMVVSGGDIMLVMVVVRLSIVVGIMRGLVIRLVGIEIRFI